MLLKSNRKRKGITLVEILITFTIMIIALAVIGPFFISNLKFLNQTETKSDLQEEGQTVLANITMVGMGCNAIDSITDVNNNDVLNTKEITNAEEIVLKYQSNKYTFRLNNNNLYYIKNVNGSSSSSLLSSYVTGITISPIQADSTYQYCTGINMTINFQKKEQTYTLVSKIYFRNSIN